MSGGVILAGSTAQGLVDRAIKDGYASVITTEEYGAFQAYSRKTEREALEMLIIFEKAYTDLEFRCPGMFDCDPLVHEGLIDPFGAGFYTYVSDTFNSSDPNNRKGY